MKRFVFIIGNEVGPDLKFGIANPQTEALAAALSSDPKVVEVPYESEVDMGWTWDGTNFYPPATE